MHIHSISNNVFGFHFLRSITGRVTPSTFESINHRSAFSRGWWLIRIMMDLISRWIRELSGICHVENGSPLAIPLKSIGWSKLLAQETQDLPKWQLFIIRKKKNSWSDKGQSGVWLEGFPMSWFFNYESWWYMKSSMRLKAVSISMYIPFFCLDIFDNLLCEVCVKVQLTVMHSIEESSQLKQLGREWGTHSTILVCFLGSLNGTHSWGLNFIRKCCW